MKQLSHNLSMFLPKRHSHKYGLIALLYMISGDEIRLLYSFDPIKNVAYTSDYNCEEYHYMSLFEIYYDGWIILSKDEALMRIYQLDSFTLPF